MKIFVAGGGPAGLYAACLIKRLRPAADITLAEQNARGATFGFGVVFSDKALEFLREGDPETHALIQPEMQAWRDLTIVHRGEAIRIDGIGFAAIGRLRLLNLLQARLESLGVTPRYGTVMRALPRPEDFDLIIAADGVNSPVRDARREAFGARIEPLKNFFAWFGTTREFSTLTQTFAETEHGPFNAHHYRYAPGMSTFIAECGPRTFQRAGLGAMSEEESRKACEAVFADALDGHQLITNRSLWRNFPVVSNARWHHKNTVLLGDALRTAHFSIGSGTRLALEDAIALAQALQAENFNIARALPAYEAARRPAVDKLVAGANASAAWYEDFGAHMKLAPFDFAMSYIQRSGRIDPERLNRLAPEFAKGYERQAGGKEVA